MTKKKQLQETISDLEAGIKSPATPAMFKTKMKAELEKNKKALADLEAEEEKKKKENKPSPKPKPTKPTGGNRGIKPEGKPVPKPEPKPSKKENPIEKAKRLAKERRKKQTGVPTGAGDIERDAARPAKPIGKRISKEGNTYYEYRDNRIDKKQPPKRYPKLEDGGELTPTPDNQFEVEGAGMFAKGGALNHGFMKGDMVLEIYKGYAIIENNGDGVIQVINPEKGTRFVIDLDDSKMSGARTSSGMSKEEQMEAAKIHIDNSRPIELGINDGNYEAEFAFGGRLKSAIMRDRAYKSDEPHEQAYDRKSRPKNPKYKYEDGGELHRIEGQADVFGDGGVMVNLHDGGLDADPRFDINSPQFKKGGTIQSKYNYLSARDIESVTTWDGVNIDGDKILDGIYIKKGVKL